MANISKLKISQFPKPDRGSVRYNADYLKLTGLSVQALFDWALDQKLGALVIDGQGARLEGGEIGTQAINEKGEKL